MAYALFYHNSRQQTIKGSPSWFITPNHDKLLYIPWFLSCYAYNKQENVPLLAGMGRRPQYLRIKSTLL